jgi:hypothetical protein
MILKISLIIIQFYCNIAAMTVVETLPLGSQGLRVSQQGLGCMGMTAFYGNFNRAEQESRSLDTIAKALDLGLNFFDTAWIYQSFGYIYMYMYICVYIYIYIHN